MHGTILFVVLNVHMVALSHAYECKSYGKETVFYDPLCSTSWLDPKGGLGCNAGGQGANCRFCGFGPFIPCPNGPQTNTPPGSQTKPQTNPAPSPQTINPTRPQYPTRDPNLPVDHGLPNDFFFSPDTISLKPAEQKTKPSSILDSSHKGPLPTNSWHQNCWMGNGDGILQTSPYLVVSDLLRGFKVSGSLKNGFTVQNKYILQNFNADWIIKATQAFVSKKARDVKPMSVLLRHNTDAGSMDIPLVQGMPFITAVYRNLAPSLATIRSILSVRVDDSATFAQGSTTSKGTKFVVHLNSNAYWVIYSSNPIAFKISNELTAQEIGNFVIKIGLLGLEDLSSKWDRFSKSYAESADIKHQTIDNIAILTYAWEKKGTGDLLMFALPHHVDHLVSGQRAGIVSYTIKGEMQGIIGDEWKMEMQLSTIEWYARNPIDPNKKQDILNALKAEVNDASLKIKAGDPYWFGLEIARAARWALIADQLNENEIAKQVRSTMKDALIPWLEYKNANPLKYETIYGGLCSTNGLSNDGADYGNGLYNDHNFHYGYHVYAAAVIAKEDAQFLAKYKNQILMYVRDYANPSQSDPFFVFSRSKDWFTWHSWAGGLFVFGDNRNQESTSESINSYYAVSLLGNVLNNKYIGDFGRMLNTMEILSTKKYWQMPSFNTVYPEPFRSNLMVGMVWSTKADYATWFGGNPEFIHGINFLPFTPITEEYLDVKFMKEEKVFLDKNTVSVTDDWMGYMIEAKAIVDKENQWDAAKRLKYFHAGSSRTNVYYWIATR